jgi:hypothetical protein
MISISINRRALARTPTAAPSPMPEHKSASGRSSLGEWGTTRSPLGEWGTTESQCRLPWLAALSRAQPHRHHRLPSRRTHSCTRSSRTRLDRTDPSCVPVPGAGAAAEAVQVQGNAARLGFSLWEPISIFLASCVPIFVRFLISFVLAHTRINPGRYLS